MSKKPAAASAPVIEIAKEEVPIIRKKRAFKEQYELDTIEKELPQLQDKKSSLEKELLELGDQYDKIVVISQELKEISDRIDAYELRWLELND